MPKFDPDETESENWAKSRAPKHQRPTTRVGLELEPEPGWSHVLT